MFGYRRMLDMLPRCIFLQFDNVSWTVHPSLGVGVFPLFPIQRTWILNAATEAKIRRTGYCLLPDFAWTAFMAQGMTLQAGIADCGDVLDTPSALDQMNTYVILSRLK